MCRCIQPSYYQSCGWIIFGALMAAGGVIYLIILTSTGGRSALSEPRASLIPVLCVAGLLTMFMGCCLLCNTSNDVYFHWKTVKQKQKLEHIRAGGKIDTKIQAMPIVSGYHPAEEWP